MPRRTNTAIAFFAVAAVVIVIDKWRGPDESSAPAAITPEVSDALAREYEVTAGRAPEPDELARLEAQWRRDEVMIRYARQLGLDRGDPVVRRRLLHKVRELAALGPEPTDAAIAAYYESHRERFWVSERVDVDVIWLRPTDRAAEVLAALERGEPPGSLGRPSSLGIRQRALTADTLRERLSLEVPDAVLDLPAGKWASLKTARGPVVLRVAERHGARLRPLEQVRVKIVDELRSTERAERIRRFEARLLEEARP